MSPGVYAAGDVAMTIDSITSEWVNNATWPSATRQGIIAGTNMAGGNLTYVSQFFNECPQPLRSAGDGCRSFVL